MYLGAQMAYRGRMSIQPWHGLPQQHSWQPWITLQSPACLSSFSCFDWRVRVPFLSCFDHDAVGGGRTDGKGGELAMLLTAWGAQRFLCRPRTNKQTWWNWDILVGDLLVLQSLLYRPDARWCPRALPPLHSPSSWISILRMRSWHVRPFPFENNPLLLYHFLLFRATNIETLHNSCVTIFDLNFSLVRVTMRKFWKVST